MIFDKTNCCLTMHNLFHPMGRTEFLWEILFVGTGPVRKAFGVRMFNPFPAHFKETVNNIFHSFYSFSQFPIGNAFCYSIMKLNKNARRTKWNKTNKTHIYVYIFALFMHGSLLKSRPMNKWHIFHKCSNK